MKCALCKKRTMIIIMYKDYYIATCCEHSKQEYQEKINESQKKTHAQSK